MQLTDPNCTLLKFEKDGFYFEKKKVILMEQSIGSNLEARFLLQGHADMKEQGTKPNMSLLSISDGSSSNGPKVLGHSLRVEPSFNIRLEKDLVLSNTARFLPLSRPAKGKTKNDQTKTLACVNRGTK